jgi:hypothetical protein
MAEHVLHWLGELGFTYSADFDGQGWMWQAEWNVAAPI